MVLRMWHAWQSEPTLKWQLLVERLWYSAGGNGYVDVQLGLLQVELGLGHILTMFE